MFLQSRYADISGAAFRFTLVADPVRRFAALFRHHVQGKAFPGWEAVHELDHFIARFDEFLQVAGPIAPWFGAQARAVAVEPRLDAVFSLACWTGLQQALHERLQLTLPRPPECPPASGIGQLLKRWRSPFWGVSAASRKWLRQRYADDLQLYREPPGLRPVVARADG